MMANHFLKTLTTIIAVLCFVPLSIVFFFGLLFLPNWIGMLVLMLTDDQVVPIAEGQVWTLVIPILVVIAGSLGLFGLFRILKATRQDEGAAEDPATTLLLCATGLGAIALLLTYTSVSFTIDYLTANLPFLLVYLILPIVGAVMLLVLARQALFKRGKSDAE